MAQDYRVKRRSNDELRKDAATYKKRFINGDLLMVDIKAELESGWIETIVGRKRLHIELISDTAMGKDDASTESLIDRVIIRFKQSVSEKLYFGDGRARFTAAHELAHGRLNHSKAIMARGTGVSISSPLVKLFEKSESAEHQANEWASHYLIDEKNIHFGMSVEDIAIKFGVSLTAATIRFNQLIQRRERPKLALKFAELSASLKSMESSCKNKICFLPDMCSACGNATLIPIGNKFMCQTCEAVTDNFQDGD